MSSDRSRSRRRAVIVSLLFAAVLGGCGSASNTVVSAPVVGPARTFSLAGFKPPGTVLAHHPVTVSFTVQLPDGRPLTRYRTGSGPHTGVHLIIVRDDLAYIIHEHPPVGPNGVLVQSVRFPSPGRYRVLVDIYPNVPGLAPNFQLHQTVNVSGAYHPQRLPAFKPDLVVDGFHVDMQRPPALHAIQATFLHVTVTSPQGRKVTFVPWFGALAHAIFFRRGSLDYFHTHICAPNAPNCGTLAGVGSTRIAGRSTAPGKLTIGVLVPVPGTWRLFLQMKLDGHIVTAPYTLTVN